MQGNREGFERVDQLFQSGELLAKSLNKIQIEDDKLNYTSFLKEGDLLVSPNGCSISSTTLLVAGHKIPTYSLDGMSSGLLIDASKSFIIDVSKQDANTERAGKLAKRKARLDGAELDCSLKELKDHINSTNATDMNEVSADIKIDGVVGIFVKAQADSEQKMGAILAVKMFESIHGVKLPLVQYDQRNGSIQEIEVTQDVVKNVAKDMQQSMKKTTQYIDEYTKYLGLEYAGQFLIRDQEPVLFCAMTNKSRAITVGQLFDKLKERDFNFNAEEIAIRIAGCTQDFNGDTYDEKSILDKQITFPRSRLIDGVVFEFLEVRLSECFSGEEKERFEGAMKEIKVQNINIDRKSEEEIAKEKAAQCVGGNGAKLYR
ncbi:MAG: hypothetical protein ACK5WS_01955 [Alphaproteobacteria bacterium]|jgi:hypothetical protein|nr:hypothetical protein [Candidatus Jidaibacter sp.]